MENGLKIDTIATADVVFAGSKHIVDKANDENKDFSPISNPKRTKKKKKKSIRRDDNLIVSTSTSFATTSSSDTQSDCVTPTLKKSVLSSSTETASKYTKSKVVKKTKGLVEGRKISTPLPSSSACSSLERGNGRDGRGRGRDRRGRGRGRGLLHGGRRISESQRSNNNQERIKNVEMNQRMKQQSIRVGGKVANGRYSTRGGRRTPPVRGDRKQQSIRAGGSIRVADRRHTRGGQRVPSFPGERSKLEADNDINVDRKINKPRISTRNIYRAPSNSKSILRRSNHHQGDFNSNHSSILESPLHHSKNTISSNSSLGTGRVQKVSRVQDNSYELYSNGGTSFNDDESIYMEDLNDGDDGSFVMEVIDGKTQREVPRTIVGMFSRSLSSAFTMDLSGHSVGLETGSSHHSNISNGNFNGPRRFKDENICIRSLRYIRILAPYSNEKTIKKKIRIVTWLALLLDFINALVAIITYGGETTQCCGKSIMSAFGGSVDWDRTILIITCVYMVLIFLEVLPVVRDGFPFNLLNPVVGFLITFAVFFSDSIIEATVMWTIEASAVFCELYNYRLRQQMFTERKNRLIQTKKEIRKLRKIKRRVKKQYESSQVLTSVGSSHEILNINLSDSDSFAEDDSFIDEMESQNPGADNKTVRSRLTTIAVIGNVREDRLLRERRTLIQSQTEDGRELRLHFVGVSINVFLVVFSLLMIVIIAKNGGMCIKGMQFGNIFKNNQLDECSLCQDIDGPCEKCFWEDATETVLSPNSQCYYPYGRDK